MSKRNRTTTTTTEAIEPQAVPVAEPQAVPVAEPQAVPVADRIKAALEAADAAETAARAEIAARAMVRAARAAQKQAARRKEGAAEVARQLIEAAGGAPRTLAWIVAGVQAARPDIGSASADPETQAQASIQASLYVARKAGTWATDSEGRWSPVAKVG